MVTSDLEKPEEIIDASASLRGLNCPQIAGGRFLS
jgi:hypothetical protein